jgi:hypothetical protein
METCEQPIFPIFEDSSQFSPPASLASRLPLPGSEEARLMTVGSGRQCSMLLDSFSPLGAFSRILLGSSHWTNSEEYCYVWDRLDTRFALSAFQLTQLGQNTCGTECLLWPTPDAKLSDSGPDYARANRPGSGGDDLTTRIHKLWPTPTVPNGGRRNPEGTSITGRKPDGGKAQIDLREFAIRTGELSGSLNPRFVEELMGFRIDHTALKHWETVLSRSRRTRSSKRSPRPKKNKKRTVLFCRKSVE